MNKNIVLAGLLMIGFAGIVAAATASPSASANAGANGQYGKGLGYLASQYPAQWAQFKEAVDGNNYELALELHEKYGFGGRMFDNMTPEKFAIMQKLHAAIQSGDSAKITELRQELGIGNGQRNGFGKGMANGIDGQRIGIGNAQGSGAGRGKGRGMGMNGNCPNA